MMVKRPKIFKHDGKQRQGKGFSPEELKKVGLSLTEGARLHVPIDPRRKTAHEGNVEALKTFLEDRKTTVKTKKAKRKPKS